MFGQKAVAVAPGQQICEEIARLLGAAQSGQRVNVPEGANHKRIFRHAEIILLDVAVNVVAVAQLPLDGGDGFCEARIVGRQKSDVVDQKQARVERIAFEGSHKGLFLFVPRPPANGFVDNAGLALPVGGPVGKADVVGDPGQTVAGGPAHDAGKGMNAQGVACLPWSGIRLIVN
jgi:hypothetical protein